SVGAAIAIITNQSFYTLQILAFSFGLLAVGLTYLISRFWGGNQTLVLVLGGIVIGSLFAAILSLLEYLYANPASSATSKLPNILFWLLGSFASADWTSVYELAPILVSCMVIVFLLRWRLNVLSMGDEEARSLGVNTSSIKAILIVCVTLITAASISVCGTVGWIGLVIPQTARMLGGPNNKVLIPTSMLLGASFLLIVDTICRSLVSYEIPISIVTSIVGAPVFLYILKKNSEAWP
ncbi:MAG: FecCD family ABC transporter permease, partial [Candidatus Bathyarchaeia archaeon]